LTGLPTFVRARDPRGGRNWVRTSDLSLVSVFPGMLTSGYFGFAVISAQGYIEVREFAVIVTQLAAHPQ
jgi:hypothetical protein